MKRLLTSVSQYPLPPLHPHPRVSQSRYIFLAFFQLCQNDSVFDLNKCEKFKSGRSKAWFGFWRCKAFRKLSSHVYQGFCKPGHTHRVLRTIFANVKFTFHPYFLLVMSCSFCCNVWLVTHATVSLRVAVFWLGYHHCRPPGFYGQKLRRLWKLKW